MLKPPAWIVSWDGKTDATGPDGLMPTDKVTFPANPFTLSTLTTAVFDDPTGTLIWTGFTETRKSCTLTITCTLWIRPPLRPVTVKVKLIIGVFFETEIDRVELAFPLGAKKTLVGVKFVVKPVDDTFTVKETKPVKPFKLVTVIVEPPELPTWIGTTDELDEIEKSIAMNVIEVECTMDPLVPVTVTV